MPSIKGTASVADARERSKALKSTKFPANFSKKIKLDKVNKPVLTQWIEQKVTSILGFDDEIVSSTAINLFLPSDGSNPDPRRAQLDLAGFLGEDESATFAKELWTLLVEAQESASGIPRTLLEAKKKELSQQKQLSHQPGGRMQQQQYARGPANNNVAGRADDPDMNRFVQEANRRAAAVRHLVPEVADAGEGARPVPIPVSPPHPSEQPAADDRMTDSRSNRRSQDSDRKMPARRSGSRSRYDRGPPPRHLPPPPGYDDGHLPPPPPPHARGGYRRDVGRGNRRSSRDRSRSAEYGPPPPVNRYHHPAEEDEFRRSNGWRRDDPPALPPPPPQHQLAPPPPPLRHPDDRNRRRGGGSPGRGRRRYYSEEDEMEDLERRLSVLKKRVVKRGDDYALDDEIEDIEDRLDELDRRRRRRRREQEEEEYRRRGRRGDPRDRSRSRSRSNGDRGRPIPGPPPPRRSPPPGRPDRRRRGPSSESEKSGRRRRSPSSDDDSTGSSRSSSSGSSRSSEDSRKRGRGSGERRGRSRSVSSSRSDSDDSRR